MTSLERKYVMDLLDATEDKLVLLPKEIAEEYSKADSMMALSDEKANDERETKKAAAMADAAGSTLAVCNAHGKRKATPQSRGKRNRK